ncbi:MAG TPA: SET domain-containing protein-lysine N-methyltransferase [Enhygromyxa sp.]|nr:SET domain-containing protein-lysine N-methyltransferase [Enhygromyxa sp.]
MDETEGPEEPPQQPLDELQGQPSGWLAPSLVGRRGLSKGGHGVFARRPIARGELLAVFGGTVVSAEQLRSASSTFRRLTLQIDEDLFVVSTVEGPADWFNHACEPNAGLRGQLSLVALRPIAAGEEVCYDYAMSDGSAYDEFPCDCGAGRCRGRVTGDDWQLPELWNRYGDHFSPYLLARIESLRERPNPAWAPTIVQPLPRTRSRTRTRA